MWATRRPTGHRTRTSLLGRQQPGHNTSPEGGALTTTRRVAYIFPCRSVYPEDPKSSSRKPAEGVAHRYHTAPFASCQSRSLLAFTPAGRVRSVTCTYIDFPAHTPAPGVVAGAGVRPNRRASVRRRLEVYQNLSRSGGISRAPAGTACPESSRYSGRARWPMSDYLLHELNRSKSSAFERNT